MSGSCGGFQRSKNRLSSSQFILYRLFFHYRRLVFSKYNLCITDDLFFLLFLSSTLGTHHHGAHCYCYFRFRPFSFKLLTNSISDFDFDSFSNRYFFKKFSSMIIIFFLFHHLIYIFFGNWTS